MFINSIDKFRDELNPAERIIWSGQPQQGLLLRPIDAFMIPFSLLWCGFAFFWELGVISDGAPFIFMIWGIPFILVGLYFVFGKFLVDNLQRKKTYYALTDQRALIISRLHTQTTRTIKYKKITDISISTKSNGKGTITFGTPNSRSWMNSLNWFPNSSTSNDVPRFEMIEDAKMVYEHIKRFQNESE